MELEIKAKVILQALLLGHRIVIGKHTYCFDNTYRLCVVGKNETLNKEALFVVDMGDGIYLKDFVNLCSKATDDEVFAIGANIVLNTL